MSAGEFLFACVCFFIIYRLLRLIFFEFLTLVLRYTPPARRWLRRLNERGRLLKGATARVRFAASMRATGNFLEWITGKGVVRGITFAAIATMILFLTTLPIGQINGGAARQYAKFQQDIEAPYGALAGFPVGLCLSENIMAETERQTGRSFLIPPSFSYYPVDKLKENSLKIMAYNQDFLVSTNQLASGRELILNVKDLPKSVTADPKNRDIIRKLSVVGKITPDTISLSPESKDNRQFISSLNDYCRDLKPDKKVNFTSFRPKDNYRVLVERFRLRILGILKDKEIRAAWFFAQGQVAKNKIRLYFIYSVFGGLLCLVIVKMSIFIFRTTFERVWIVANLAIVSAFSVLAGMVSIFLFGLLHNALVGIAPVATFILAAYFPNTEIEDKYRYHANYVIARAVDLKSETCVDIGAGSPIYAMCDMFDTALRPWNAKTRQFDFSQAVPEGKGDAGSRTIVDLIRRSPVTLLTFGGFGNDENQKEAVDILGDVARPTLDTMIVAPTFLIIVIAFLTYLMVDLRRAVTNRVYRITREKNAP